MIYWSSMSLQTADAYFLVNTFKLGIISNIYYNKVRISTIYLNVKKMECTHQSFEQKKWNAKKRWLIKHDVEVLKK